MDYNGGRTASDIVGWVLGELKKAANSRLGSGGHDHSGHDHSGHSHGGSGDSDEKDVVVLDDSNFDELVLNSDSPWFIEFYAPWVTLHSFSADIARAWLLNGLS